ncbi:MAG: nucleotidyltransferase family protein, partial [Anaerolineales bacterium]|nr:nucleotidyltransferase family protein [Anaerolineales bacterium]
QAAAVDDILLVSGGYRTEVEAIAQTHGVPFVHNPQFATGEMLSSLKTAVRFLQTQQLSLADAILVMLGDLPFLEPEILNQVIEAYRNGRGRLIAPAYQGKRGHPVLIDAQFFAELLALPAAGAPRDLIRNHPEALYLVEVGSDVILRDIDTPEQYERWRP